MVNTLLLYSLDPYSQTDRQTDRQRNKYTRFAWAGGTFFHFQLCCCVSFWFWREIGFGFTYYYVLRVPNSCGVVLFLCSGGKQFLVLPTYLDYNTVVRLCHFCCCCGKVNFVQIFLFNLIFLLFLVLAGNSFWCYIGSQCTIQLCGCVSFFVVAGKLILYRYLTVTIVSQEYRELSL